MHCGFMDSRLRRFPPDRASAVSYGQTVGNATRCPPLAHRSAAAHKLHSARPDRDKIRESQNHLYGSALSLFHPGGRPSYRDHRNLPVQFQPSLLQNSSFVEDLFARACDFKEVRAAISGMMRLPSRSS